MKMVIWELGYESRCRDETLNEHLLGCVEIVVEGALSRKKMGKDRGKREGRRGVKRRAKSTGVQSAGVRAVRRNAGSAMKTSNQGSTLQCTVYFSLSIYQFLINNSSHFYLYIFRKKKKGVIRLNFKRYHHFFSFSYVTTMLLIFIA